MCGGGSILPSSNHLFSPTKVKVNQVASDIIKPNIKEFTKNPFSYHIKEFTKNPFSYHI